MLKLSFVFCMLLFSSVCWSQGSSNTAGVFLNNEAYEANQPSQSLERSSLKVRNQRKLIVQTSEDDSRKEYKPGEVYGYVKHNQKWKYSDEHGKFLLQKLNQQEVSVYESRSFLMDKAYYKSANHDNFVRLKKSTILEDNNLSSEQKEVLFNYRKKRNKGIAFSKVVFAGGLVVTYFIVQAIR